MQHLYADENRALSVQFYKFCPHRRALVLKGTLLVFHRNSLSALLYKPQRIQIPCALSVKGFPPYTPPRRGLTATPK